MFKQFICTFSAAATMVAAAFTPVQATGSNMLTSWYGPGFHGRITANGEVYDQYALTAAHKTLPFGTKLRVCYRSCVDVRVNDRGPYIGARELDLSYAAAQSIGLVNTGVDYVSITYI